MAKLIDYANDTDARNRLKYITRVYVDNQNHVCSDRCRVVYANKDLIYFKKPDGGSYLDYVNTGCVCSTFDEAMESLGDAFVNRATIYCTESIDMVDIDLEQIKLRNNIYGLKWYIRNLKTDIVNDTKALERLKSSIDRKRETLLVSMQQLAAAKQEYEEKYGKDENKND